MLKDAITQATPSHSVRVPHVAHTHQLTCHIWHRIVILRAITLLIWHKIAKKQKKTRVPQLAQNDKHQ